MSLRGLSEVRGNLVSLVAWIEAIAPLCGTKTAHGSP